MTANVDLRIFSQNDLLNGYGPALSRFRRANKFCDAIIRVGNSVILAHRIVLTAGIPYFAAIFKTKFPESEGHEIFIEDIDPESVESLINYAYSGEVKITPENARALTLGSDWLQIAEVRDACIEFLSSRFHSENVVEIRKLADAVRCRSLIERCDQYIRENFDTVCVSKGFLNLPFFFFNELISRSDLNVIREENVYEAVMRWVKYSLDERVFLLPELLKNVRMQFLELDYLTECLEAEALILKSVHCQELVTQAKLYHIFPKIKTDFNRLLKLFKERLKGGECVHNFRQNFNLCDSDTTSLDFLLDKYIGKSNSTPYQDLGDEGRLYNLLLRSKAGFTVCPRRYKENKISVAFREMYAVTYTTNLGRTVRRYNWEHEQWTDLVVDNQFKSFETALSDASKIYTLGQNSIEAFDLKTQEWTPLGTINKTICKSGLVLHKNKIYCFGGGNLPSTKVLCFDIRQNTWLTKGRIAVCRNSPAVVSMGKHIYIIGDHYHKGPLSSIEKYTPVLEESCEVSAMLFPKQGSCSAATDGKLYVCGVQSEYHTYSSGVYECTSEVYDPILDQWSVINPMFNSRYLFSLVPFRGKLYAFSRNSPVAQIYDPYSNVWKLDDDFNSFYTRAKAKSAKIVAIPNDN